MTREDAMGYLKGADVTVGREPKTKTAEALEMAIKALEQTRWIPVSERLPEENGRYIVTTHDDEEIYVTTSYYQNDEYVFFSNEEIIAWMPLPEPYREDGEMNDE